MQPFGILTRIDGKSNTPLDIKIDGAKGLYRQVAIGEGAVWVPDVGAGLVYKIDPSSNRVILRVPAAMSGNAGTVAAGEGSLWVVTGNDSVLSRFDAAEGREQAKIVLPGRGICVLVDGGSVWVTDYLRGTLMRIDPKTNVVSDSVQIGSSPYTLVFVEGAYGAPTRRA